MFEAVMERSAWEGGEMGSMPTPRPPQARNTTSHEAVLPLTRNSSVEA
jgi:hypothetical protein